MDTKLKKFNLSALFKLIAIALCLLCVGGTVTQLVSSLIKAEERELRTENFYDAVYYGSGKEIWETKSFKVEYNLYADKLLHVIANYGDGSEKAYETKTEALRTGNEESFAKAKKNLIAQIKQDQGFFDYLVALSSGDIVNCGFVEMSDKHDSDNYFSEEEIFDSDVDYAWLISDNFNTDKIPYEITLTDEARKTMEETKADGAVLLSSSAWVDDYDGSTVASYPAGYYLFKVDENTLFENLVENGIIKDIQPYEQFKKEYDYEQKYIQENFPSGRYYLRDTEGRTYTNIGSLGKKSAKDDITEAFEKLGFYTRTDLDSGMLLSDGRYYTDVGYYTLNRSDIFVVDRVYNYMDEIPELSTTGVTQTTTTLPPVTVPETTVNNSSQTTTYVVGDITSPAEPTTYHYTEDTFRVLTEKDAPDIYIGVDMKSEAYENRMCRFSQVNNNIVLARDMAKDTIKTCGALMILFIALFIFLILYSGRRFGDRENVYMFRLDNMFTDLRIILDCGIGFLIALLIIWILDEFFSSSNVNEIVILALGTACAAFGAVLLDLVLFITRHIKNKSLFKRASAVWLVRTLSEKTGKVFKIDMRNKLLNILLALFIPVNVFLVFFIWGICNNEYELLICMTALVSFDLVTIFLLLKEKKWLEPLKEKLQYVRGFEKETVIKGIIVLAINAVLGLLAIIEITNTETLWFSFILIGFDIFVAVQLIRFIAGVKKIFSAVNELKEGNYDVQINLFALPSALREPASKLMSLRDGLKTAVEEAVKQEQTKTELITNVSHDLKTPLTSVINYVELLKKCNITDENAKEYLNILGEKSDRLKKLIEDLVEASKASTGNLKVEFMQVSLNEITSQIIGEFSDIFDENGLSLITSLPEESIIVRADSKMLYRVLENLMGNVSKYAMENTRVYLSVDKRDGRGVISVKNISGSPLNITAEQLKARFVRGDEARTTEGSGLGLSIAESLCELMGGRLNIEINGDLFVAEVEISIN